MKTLIIAILTLFMFVNLQAQNVEFEKKNFPDKKEEFKLAKNALEDGDKLFEDGLKHCEEYADVLVEKERYCRESLDSYSKAVEFYTKAQAFNPNNALLNFRLGVCYLYSSNKDVAITYFETAYKLNPGVDHVINYMMGKAYHINEQWDKAIASYNLQLKAFTPKEMDAKGMIVKKKIQECESGKKLSANPVRVFIDNIGDVINTPYPDYAPIISADESVLIFTSRRPNSTGGQKDPRNNQYNEDIYMSKNVNGKWTPPMQFTEPINTKGHDAAVGLSNDGQRFFIYRGEINKGDLFEVDQKGESWSNPENLKNINSDYHEASATFSYDYNTIYFVSDRVEGSYGGHDIWMSTKNEKGKWGKPTNIGPSVNTAYEEKSVFMHPDGKTLYFSSNGHNSMGGLDIFKVVNINGVWGEPVNIGYPINTPDDDAFFSINAKGTRGYYTSAKKGGLGEKDIYVVTFLGPEKSVVINTEDNLFSSIKKPVTQTLEPPVALPTAQLTLLKGTITDAITNQPVEASIDLYDNTENKLLATFKSNSKTGKFLVSLPAGKNYGIAVRGEGYLFHSENFDVPATAAYQEVNKDIALKKVEVGSKIVLRNIFFDFDQATLKKESYAELERLAALLTELSTMRIEISGHTDNKGSEQYNQKLSERRAQTVVNYLITEKKIAASRLEYKGYGKAQPIATNDTDDGRQQNRRTEFKILSK